MIEHSIDPHRYYEQGYNAYNEGVSGWQCPYVLDSVEGEEWSMGWSVAYSEDESSWL